MKETIRIDELLTREYKPTTVLVVYEGINEKRGVYYENKDGLLYVEAHDVISGTLQPGKPVTRKFLNQLALLAQDEKNHATATTRSIMPENVLFHDTRPGRNIVAWYQKAGLQHMKLRSDKETNFYIPMPDLIFYASGAQMHVYAMCLNGKRPTEDTKLYRAPVWNTSDRGAVCMGNVKHPDQVEDIRQFMEQYSQAFWGGVFTHPSGTPAKKALPQLYRSLKKAKKFPAEVLIESEMKRVRNLLTL